METAMDGYWATMETAVGIGGCWSAREKAAATVHEHWSASGTGGHRCGVWWLFNSRQ